MKTVIALAQPLAAGATASVSFPVPPMQTFFQVRLAASYAAVSATSGVSCAILFSQDGTGTTFAASGDPAVVVKPAATVLGQTTAFLQMDRFPGTNESIYPDHAKLTVTNLDATNAASVVVLEYVFDVANFGEGLPA